MNEFAASLFNVIGLALWIEISTESPKCVYYFGPFTSQAEAKKACEGYLEDLRSEGAQGIQVVTKRCKPTTLTIFEDDWQPQATLQSMPSLSGQTF